MDHKQIGYGRILRDQIALVTGASSGIGTGVAEALGAAGARVIVNYNSNAEAGEEVAHRIIENGGDAIAVGADVRREDQVLDMFQKVINHYGTVDIMVNNAGIQIDEEFHKTTTEQWYAVVDTHLTGTYLCSREAIKVFLKRGMRDVSRALGKILCMSSVHDIIPWAFRCNYAAAKGGILLLMKSMAQEYADRKIRVNAISPGAIRTPLNRPSWETPEAERDLLKLVPYNRIGEPEDVGKLAVWLASDESDYITGTTIYIDGGMITYPSMLLFSGFNREDS
jgi:glucose 1-dehydrogenase